MLACNAGEKEEGEEKAFFIPIWSEKELNRKYDLLRQLRQYRRASYFFTGVLTNLSELKP